MLQEQQHNQQQLERNRGKKESTLTAKLGNALEASHGLPSLPQNEKELSNK